MQFTGKVTRSDLSDVVRLTRSKTYWFKLLFANWYGAGIIIAITWVTVAGFLGQEKPNWRALGVVWMVIGGLVGWSVFNERGRQAKELSRLNATLADEIIH
jgi:hypothetical protein